MKNLFLFLLLELSIFHAALAAGIQCPNIIKTKQSLDKKIDGWDDFFDRSVLNRFDRVTFYAGHPKEHASLAPDNEGAQGNKATWTFGKGTIWLACGYYNTDIQLIRKLPDAIKTCTVIYDSTFDKVMSINCK